MNRETLREEVKGIYASLAAKETQQHFFKTGSGAGANEYYGELLDMVLDEISAGTFDNFQSGKSVMDAVAQDKRKWLSGWDDARGSC